MNNSRLFYCLAIGLIIGVWRFSLVADVRTVADNLFSKQVGQKIELVGVVIEEPSATDFSQKIILETEKVKVLVTAESFPRMEYGDQIRVKGTLGKPENFLTDNGKEFDYVNYLAKDRIFYELKFGKAEKISSGHGAFLKTYLLKFKNKFIESLGRSIREPEASLLGGLLLGERNSLGRGLQKDFRLAGVSHIVALSGYNITIVAEGVMMALSFLPRAAALTAGSASIFLFAIMTGGSATVVRASIMALLVLLAKATGRIYDVGRALIIAGVLMVLHNPMILVFDVSFQLSFLATLALIYVSPVIEKHFLFITNKFKFRELIVSTVATQIFVLPFLLYKMGLVSLVALPANLLILPIIPLIMLLGFIVGILGFISFYLAWPIALIVSLLLTYQLKMVSLFAGLPFSAVSLKSFPVSLTIFIYVFYGIIIWRFQKFSLLQTNSNSQKTPPRI